MIRRRDEEGGGRRRRGGIALALPTIDPR